MTRQVREVMSPGVPAVEPMTSLDRVARLMSERDVGEVLVVYDCDLFGVVTDRDIVVRALGPGLDLATTAVGRVCTRPPVAVVAPDDTTDDAARLMREHAVHRIPVVERGGCPVGLVSLGDLAAVEDSVLAGVARAAPDH
jgi:CBS domain-containing protein